MCAGVSGYFVCPVDWCCELGSRPLCAVSIALLRVATAGVFANPFTQAISTECVRNFDTLSIPSSTVVTGLSASFHHLPICSWFLMKLKVKIKKKGCKGRASVIVTAKVMNNRFKDESSIILWTEMSFFLRNWTPSGWNCKVAHERSLEPLYHGVVPLCTRVCGLHTSQRLRIHLGMERGSWKKKFYDEWRG